MVQRVIGSLRSVLGQLAVLVFCVGCGPLHLPGDGAKASRSPDENVMPDETVDPAMLDYQLQLRPETENLEVVVGESVVGELHVELAGNAPGPVALQVMPGKVPRFVIATMLPATLDGSGSALVSFRPLQEAVAGQSTVLIEASVGELRVNVPVQLTVRRSP